jgi:DnaK suppressor protein
MTSTVHDPLEMLRVALESQFEQHTDQLTELIAYSRQPGHGGYDRDTLNGLIATSRQGVADSAEALRRMAEGTYGVCERCRGGIPIERLKVLPHARFCLPCQAAQGR